jgi:spore germination cell wall hydrolase CwlJ-like protein
LQIKFEARAESRALAGGLVLGAAVGVLLGGAYLAGGVAARQADAHARVERLSRVAAGGFAEATLRAETETMAPGALAIARRHDAYGGGRQPAGFPSLFSPRPQAAVGQAFASAGATLLPASYAAPVNPARPFRFASGDALASTRDLDCLTDAVYYEARGESAAGQAAVAQVVLNRVRHPAFPKTVCGVVFQGADTGDACQFSFACDGSMRRTREPAAWRAAEKVAARALEGFVMPSVGNATHFHVAGLDPGWGPRLLRVAQIGLHVFYRFGGYAGAPANFNARPERSGAAPDATPHAVYASLAPLAGVSADGRPMGQFMLDAVTAPTPAPAQTQASSPAAATPAAAQPAAVKPTQTASVEPAKANSEPAAKSETAASAKPASAVS